MTFQNDDGEETSQDIDCVVREATLNDHEAISRVMQRNGLGTEDYATWSRLWVENPFRHELQIPLGWVLESKSKDIVGTFSNIPRMYSLNEEPVRVATARAWAVDPQFRSKSIFLAAKFFSQHNVDLFLDTTASAQAGAIFKAFKCREIPGPSSANMLYWVTNYAGFAGALLRKLRIPSLAGLRHAAGLALYVRDLKNLHNRQIHTQDVSILQQFDARFDDIWKLLRQRRDRLLAIRTSEALTWQFGNTLRSGDTVVFGRLEGHSISGYLIMKRYDTAHLGLSRFRIVDIQAIRDEEETILCLMSAAFQHAVRSDVHVVEAMGFHESKHSLIERLNPHHRELPSYPFLYGVSAHPDQLGYALKNVDVWDPSPFDGDAAL